MSEIPRVCATCEFFVFHEHDRFDAAGGGVGFDCLKNRWSLDALDASETEFRSTMIAAVDCDDYLQCEVEPISLETPKWKVDKDAYVALLAAYPQVKIQLEEDIRRFEWRASFFNGGGWTQSGIIRDKGEAVEWLRSRIEQCPPELFKD